MSGNLPTPPQSVSSSSGSDRNRRRRQRLDSSGESDASVGNDLRRETYTRYRYRVGAPALQPLPLATIGNDSLDLETTFDQLRPSINRILQDTVVRFYAMELVLRAVVEDNAVEQGDLTVYIKATWTGDECYTSWIRAVGRIRRLLNQRGGSVSLWKVEIVAYQLEAPRAMRPIRPGHTFAPAWPRLQPLVHYILQTSHPKLASTWITIDPIRLGPVGEGVDVLPVVVSILVDWDCNPSYWDKARKDIDELMMSNGFPDVHAEFEHGDILLTGSFELRPPTAYSDGIFDFTAIPYSQKVNMGDDVGAARYFESSPSKRQLRGGYGTLGGYLTIKENGQTLIKVGITNYHVIRPAIPGIAFEDSPSAEASVVETKPEIKGLLSKADKNGFGRNLEARRYMILESPSRRKHNATMHQLSEDRKETESKLQDSSSLERISALQQRLSRNKGLYDHNREFFDEDRHFLGTVLCGSGMARRTPGNHRLDWALVEINSDRIGKNIIPVIEKWPGHDHVGLSSLYPSEEVCGKLLRGQASLKESVQKVENGEFLDKQAGRVPFRLYKTGARTGQTCGEFSFVKHNVRMPAFDSRHNQGHSNEYCFVQSKPPPQLLGQPVGPFSEIGDSGAFCFTEDGKWAGQIWGGSRRQGVSDTFLTYITDSGDLLRSVQDLLNMKEDKYTVELSAD